MHASTIGDFVLAGSAFDSRRMTADFGLDRVEFADAFQHSAASGDLVAV